MKTSRGFELHTPESATPASADLLAATRKAWGVVPNLHRVLAESPAALQAYTSLWQVAEQTSFSPIERNVAYLAIIFENECTYCMAGHSKLSAMAGVPADVVAALRDDRALDDPRLQALQTFAAQVTRARGAVSSAEVQAFRDAGFTNRSVLDVLVLAATKLISNYANHLADTPNDAFMAGAEWRAPGKLRAA